MAQFLCLTIRFLDSTFHGRNERGTHQWPPSPLRVFEALVAAAAARWNERRQIQSAAEALRWLERQPPPRILTPPHVPAPRPLHLYVPDNIADTVARSLARQNKSAGKRKPTDPAASADLHDDGPSSVSEVAVSLAPPRTEKYLYTTYFFPDPLRYLWPIHPQDAHWPQVQPILLAAARSITHLGLGIDLVVADAAVMSDDQVAALSGRPWLPFEHGGHDQNRPSPGPSTRPGLSGRPWEDGRQVRLPVPVQGTFDQLCQCYQAFLRRAPGALVGKDPFAPVPALTQFRWVVYRQPEHVPELPWVAFRLLRPDRSQAAFDPMEWTARLAGMLCHQVAEVASRFLQWPQERVLRQVLGHQAVPSADLPAPKAVRQHPWEPRLAYLPVPSILRWGQAPYPAGAIRRILLVGMPGMEEEIDQLGKYLAGRFLIREDTGQPVALLAPIPLPEQDWVLQQYIRSAAVWASVTPVVLPGFDDRRPEKTDRLLRKALRQAGFDPELVQNAQIDFLKVGFLPRLELANRFFRPECIRHRPVWHVRITWRDRHGQPLDIPGPMFLGSGRFRGLGLCVGLGGATPASPPVESGS